MTEQPSEVRMEKLEYLVEDTRKRLNKIDDNHHRIWERLDMHRDAQVETKAKLEEVGKDVNDLEVQLVKLVDAQQNFIASFNEKLVNLGTQTANKWEQFFSKAFWLLAGAFLAVIFAKFR